MKILHTMDVSLHVMNTSEMDIIHTSDRFPACHDTELSKPTSLNPQAFATHVQLTLLRAMFVPFCLEFI
jgi:hypothetical protein